VDVPAVHLTVGVTLVGRPDPRSGYLIDIKAIDRAVLGRSESQLSDAIFNRRLALPGLSRLAFDCLKDAWPGYRVDRVDLFASPFQSSAVMAGEPFLTRLSHRFEFSAAHRLHNDKLSDADNRQLFGKCNNPAGHGHNYEVEVTVIGTPNEAGLLLPSADLERLVDEHAIAKVDHKFLNYQVPEFADVNPSVENIAKVIYGWLKPPLAQADTKLHKVTVWETPKTSCEYCEDD
jgi:6-pyruvoyltetrahydropterin/6-carboxytetrahydropterin synthase